MHEEEARLGGGFGDLGRDLHGVDVTFSYLADGPGGAMGLGGLPGGGAGGVCPGGAALHPRTSNASCGTQGYRLSGGGGVCGGSLSGGEVSEGLLSSAGPPPVVASSTCQLVERWQAPQVRDWLQRIGQGGLADGWEAAGMTGKALCGLMRLARAGGGAGVLRDILRDELGLEGAWGSSWSCWRSCTACLTRGSAGSRVLPWW